jgi:hypothetical protein
MTTTPLSLSSFQSDPTLIEAQVKLQASKPFRQLMEMLIAELPSRHAIPYGSTGEDHACANGMEIGYLRCIETVKAAAELSLRGEPIAGFGTSEETTN